MSRLRTGKRGPWTEKGTDLFAQAAGVPNTGGQYGQTVILRFCGGARPRDAALQPATPIGVSCCPATNHQGGGACYVWREIAYTLIPPSPFSFFLELAAEFNVSAERIRQIEQKAMQKMRSTMTA